MALEQIRRRDRAFERGIAIDLLESLHQRFEEVYPKSAPDVVRVDSNDPVEDCVNDIARKLRPILLERSMYDERTGMQAVDDFMDMFEDCRRA